MNYKKFGKGPRETLALEEKEEADEGIKPGDGTYAKKLFGLVVHDANNYLSASMGYFDILRRLAEAQIKSPEHKRFWHEMGTSLTGIANLMKEASKFEFKLEQLNLGDIVQEEIKKLSDEMPKEYNLALKQSPQTPIYSDRGFVRMALRNIVFNAKEAMPNGGQIEVSTDEALENGLTYGRLSVKDYGTGIPMGVLYDLFSTDKITTKGNGRGTALHLIARFLSTTHGLVEVYTEEGRGSTFNLYFPVKNPTTP